MRFGKFLRTSFFTEHLRWLLVRIVLQLQILRNIQTSFKTLVLKKETTCQLKNVRVTISFYQKQCLPVISLNKKNSSMLVVLITHTLEKTFFAATLFESLCVSFLFRQNKKILYYTLICMNLLLLRYVHVRYVKSLFTTIQRQQNTLKISLLLKKFTNFTDK